MFRRRPSGRGIGAVLVLDSVRWMARLAPDVTDRPGGRAGGQGFVSGLSREAGSNPALPPQL